MHNDLAGLARTPPPPPSPRTWQKHPSIFPSAWGGSRTPISCYLFFKNLLYVEFCCCYCRGYHPGPRTNNDSSLFMNPREKRAASYMHVLSMHAMCFYLARVAVELLLLFLLLASSVDHFGLSQASAAVVTVCSDRSRCKISSTSCSYIPPSAPSLVPTFNALIRTAISGGENHATCV